MEHFLVTVLLAAILVGVLFLLYNDNDTTKGA